MLIEKLIVYFLEGFFMAGTGFSIIGIRLKPKSIVNIAIIYTFFVSMVRMIYEKYNIPLGTHTIIILICFTIICRIITKQRILHTVMVTLISASLLLFGEGVFLLPFCHALKIDPGAFLQNNGTYIILGLISQILLIAVFIISYILKFSLINLDENLNSNE